MIIFRYLAREVLTNMFAVSLVSLLIILSGRFARFLAEAAAGKIDAAVLFTLIGFRLPYYLELILPLGLFIAILLAYGRLYVDSEMTVLSACGLSENKLLVYTLGTASIVALVVAFFALYLGPEGARKADDLLTQQRSRTEFETLKPGRFHRLSSDSGVAYVQDINPLDKSLSQIFIAGIDEASQKLSVISAQSGSTVFDEKTGKRYLLLAQGNQYRGQPGDANYEVVQFGTFQQYIPVPTVDTGPQKPSDSMGTLELMALDTLEAKAALQWRLSLPLLVMIVAFLAVPLSRTQPRQGRLGKLIPAILLYIFYLVLANAAKGAMENGKAFLPLLIWWVHGAYALLALFLFNPRLLRPNKSLAA